jgi:hypothetical protein
MVRNVIRLQADGQEHSRGQVRDIPQLAVIYKDAYKEAFAETFKGKRSKDIEAMNKASMLVPQRVYETKESNFENEIERRVNSLPSERTMTLNRAIGRSGHSTRSTILKPWAHV